MGRGQHILGLGIVQGVVDLGDGGGGVAEGGMRGDVLHALAVGVDLAPVAQRLEILRPREWALLAFENIFGVLGHGSIRCGSARVARRMIAKPAAAPTRLANPSAVETDTRQGSRKLRRRPKTPRFRQNAVARWPWSCRNGLRSFDRCLSARFAMGLRNTQPPSPPGSRRRTGPYWQRRERKNLQRPAIACRPLFFQRLGYDVSGCSRWRSQSCFDQRRAHDRAGASLLHQHRAAFRAGVHEAVALQLHGHRLAVPRADRHELAHHIGVRDGLALVLAAGDRHLHARAASPPARSSRPWLRRLAARCRPRRPACPPSVDRRTGTCDAAMALFVFSMAAAILASSLPFTCTAPFTTTCGV